MSTSVNNDTGCNTANGTMTKFRQLPRHTSGLSSVIFLPYSPPIPPQKDEQLTETILDNGVDQMCLQKGFTSSVQSTPSVQPNTKLSKAKHKSIASKLFV